MGAQVAAVKASHKNHGHEAGRDTIRAAIDLLVDDVSTNASTTTTDEKPGHPSSSSEQKPILKHCAANTVALRGDGMRLEIRRLFEDHSGGTNVLPFSRIEELLSTELDPPLQRKDVRNKMRLLMLDMPRRMFSKPSHGGKSKFRQVCELLFCRRRFTPEPTMSCDQLLEATSELITQTIEDEDIAVKRANLVSVVQRTTKRGDALMTLPLTLVYILVFMGIVTLHLDIRSRQEVEHALADWVDGREPRTSCSNNCDDMDSFWEWFLGDEDGLAGIYAVPRGEQGSVRYYLANNNILVNDVWLQRVTADGREESQWLIHSDVGKACLEKNATMYLEAAQEAARYLKDTMKWQDPTTQMIRIRFITYNELASMYSITEADIRFSIYSKIYAVFSAHAVSIAPYKKVGTAWWVATVMADVLFVAIVFNMAVAEIKDMISYARLGFSEFLDYWGYWNIIDWISINLGLATMLIWTILAIYSQQAILRDLTKRDDMMSISASELDELWTETKRLYYMYTSLHCVMALNTISIVMKFFKAFTANKRLRVVTDTFRDALVDFVHFGIIFTTIFLPFITVGHVLFGNDLEEFSSMFASVNTGLQVVLGHFEWYADLATSSNFYSRMPSGMPVFVVFMWYVTYMFMVMLVLLNMLLAIIIDKYTEIANKLNSNDTDNPKIWEQVHQWRQMHRDTKHHPLPLSQILRDLENNQEPAHPPGEDGRGDNVTVNSIIEAFRGMTKEQAMYLLRYVKDNDGREALASEPTTTMDCLKSILEDQQRIIDQKVEVPISVESKLDSNVLERLEYRVSELAETVNYIRVDQAGLARRLKKIKDCIDDAQGNIMRVPSRTIAPKPTPQQDESLQHLLKLHDAEEKRNRQRLQLPQTPKSGNGVHRSSSNEEGRPLVCCNGTSSSRSDWFPRSMTSGSRRPSEDLDNGPQFAEERE